MSVIWYYIIGIVASVLRRLARQQKVSSAVSLCVCVCLTCTLCSGDDIAEQPFEPGFLRPQPPLYHSEEEAMWLNSTQGQCPIQWDTLMCSHSAAGVLFQPTGGVAHYHDVIP